MLKKYFIGLLTLAILNFTGCTYLEVISNEDVSEGRAQINLSEELFLTTKDFTRYHFLAYKYQIADDTLYGSGAIEASSSIASFKGAIALDEVINFEQSKPDTGATIGLIGGIIAIGLIVFGIIVAVGYGISSSSIL